MKRVILNFILIFNALIWTVLSAVNYVGVMRQLNEDVIRIFIWSFLTITMYVIIIYSITLVITRIYLFYQYSDNKIKYVDNRTMGKHILCLAVTVIYVYGVCYFNSNFLGLLPAIIFFSRILTELGRFYVYQEDQLLIVESLTKEYVVLNCSQSEGKVDIQMMDVRNLDVKEKTCHISAGEMKFLSGYFMKEADEKEVA